MWVRSLHIGVLAGAALLLAQAGYADAQSTNSDPARIPVPGASRTYGYNGKQYSSAEAALKARRANVAEIVKGVPEDKDPVPGRVRIVLADRDRLRALFPGKPPASQKFWAENEYISEQEVADAIRHAGTFETVTVVDQNDTLAPEPGDDDYVVWYQVRSIAANNVGRWVASWQVRLKDSPLTTQVAFDPGVAAGTPRVAAFVKTVRQAAINLGNGIPGGIAGAGRSGSGFFLNAAGQVVTNDHVIKDCGTVRIIDTDHKTVAATVIAHDSANDLALLATGTTPRATARLRETATVRAGENVVVTGYPLAGLVGSDMSVTTGSLTSLAGVSDDTRIFQISAPIQPGNSGGPLLDSEGNVIGVVASTINWLRVAMVTGGSIPQNVNFAIKASVLRNFLEANNADFGSIAERPAQDLQTPDIADISRGFTVKVACETKAAAAQAAVKPKP